MSVEMQHVKRRIAGTRQIGKVTQALQRVASARLVHERRDLAASVRYLDALRHAVAVLCGHGSAPDHPLVLPPPWQRTALIVFGSDRGLCGAFNRAVMDHMNRTCAGEREQTQLMVVGKVVRRRAARQGYRIMRYFHQPPRAMRRTIIGSIAAAALAAYRDGRVQRVDILYTRFEGGLNQEPVRYRLLPVDTRALADASPPGPPLPLFEPGADVLLDRLLPHYIDQALDTAFMNSAASEDASRQASMSRASENAEAILKQLHQTYSRLRQESITTEMMELAGAEQADSGAQHHG